MYSLVTAKHREGESYTGRSKCCRNVTDVSKVSQTMDHSFYRHSAFESVFMVDKSVHRPSLGSFQV